MSAKPKSVRKVLFVDDDPAFLDMIESVFANWTNGHWQFLRAGNAGKAMSVLEDQLVDLVVIDLHLPGVDGLQFLRVLHRRYGNIPKAMMTGHADPVSKADCLSNGAAVYLEKPRSLDDMEGVFATLDELSKWQPEGSGFRGVLRQITLPEVVQLECLNKNSSVLEISSGITRGQVFIHEGNLIHAQAGGHKGQIALSYLLSLKGGEFNLKPYFEPPEITIEGSWEALIMEAAQSSDETETAFFRKVPKKDVATPSAAPMAPAELAPTASTYSLPPVSELSAKTSGGFNDDVLAPRTEEMLVCSAKGDVLYSWQCPQPQGRLNLMEDVRQSTLHLSEWLGAFDRLDGMAEKHFVLIRLRPDSQIFLHTYLPGQSATP